MGGRRKKEEEGGGRRRKKEEGEGGGGGRRRSGEEKSIWEHFAVENWLEDCEKRRSIGGQTFYPSSS